MKRHGLRDLSKGLKRSASAEIKKHAAFAGENAMHRNRYRTPSFVCPDRSANAAAYLGRVNRQSDKCYRPGPIAYQFRIRKAMLCSG